MGNSSQHRLILPYSCPLKRELPIPSRDRLGFEAGEVGEVQCRERGLWFALAGLCPNAAIYPCDWSLLGGASALRGNDSSSDV